MSQCRSCDARILWAKTEAGKAMPVDREPTPEGNLLLRGDGTVHVVAEGEVLPGMPLHTSHFVTCPERDSWRKRR